MPKHLPVYGATPGAQAPDFQQPWDPPVVRVGGPQTPPPQPAPKVAYPPFPYPQPVAPAVWHQHVPPPAPSPVLAVDLGPQVLGPAMTPDERLEMLRPYLHAAPPSHDDAKR